MSTRKASEDIRRVEERLHDVVWREFESRRTELRSAGLHLDLDPVCRAGEGPNYVSYIEATLRLEDDDVHDIIFFYVARDGRLVVDPETANSWISRSVEESLRGLAAGESPEGS